MSVLPSLSLAVVILNWNAASRTIRSVRSVASWYHLCPTVWIADNGSRQDDIDALAQACPDAQIVRNGTNLGFAGGNNAAIHQALKAGAQAILLLNNDAFIREHDAARLGATLLSDARIGMAGPLLYDASERSRLLSAGGRDIGRHINTHHTRPRRGEPIVDVHYVPGTVVVIRGDVLRTLGLLDERYFFSGEVADLCERARRASYRCVVDARARALHAQHAPSRLRATLYAYYALRNRFLFAAKFWPRRPWLQAFWLAYGLGIAVAARLAGRSAHARAMYLAVVDGMRGWWGDQNDRVLAATATYPRP